MIAVSALLFLLAGCGAKDETVLPDNKGTAAEEPAAESADEKLTLEYVCEEFGMDESEFADVDFDAFVDYYGLTYENIGEGNSVILLLPYLEKADRNMS